MWVRLHLFRYIKCEKEDFSFIMGNIIIIIIINKDFINKLNLNKG